MILITRRLINVFFTQAIVGLPEGQTLIQHLLSQFSLLQTAEFFLRIVLACACGAAIGYERSRRFKGAGIRTHIIVCCGAALIMIVSKYGFADLTGPLGEVMGGTRGADPARIAAQVVSGISFLGAGVIFKNNGVVKGLTTAAGLWVTSGIGLAIGSGLFTVGIFCTVLVAILQVLMHKFKIGADSFNAYRITFTVKEDDLFREAWREQMRKWEAHTTESSMEKRDDGSVSYEMTLRTTQTLELEDMMDFFSNRTHAHNVSLNDLH